MFSSLNSVYSYSYSDELFHYITKNEKILQGALSQFLLTAKYLDKFSCIHT